MSKPFDVELFQADNPAIDNLIAYLKSLGWSAWYNPDKYGIDVLATDPDGKRWEIEVEVKHSWKGAKFPYPAVHFSARKTKFAYDNSIFVMFNDDRSYALGVRGSVVAKSRIVEKDTVYTRGEQFIEVPISKVRIWRFQ